MARQLRADSLSNLFIATSRAKFAFERFNQLMQRSKEANYCQAMFVLGASGCGKTHILKEWIRLRKVKEPGFKALISEVPSNLTHINQMLEQLLDDLGDPDPSYGSPGERKRRIRQLAAGYDVIFIDEVQRLVDANTGKVKKDVAAWFANFLNYEICPLVLCGEKYADRILEGEDDNEYLDRRLLGPIPIEPYDWHEKVDRQEFRAFLSRIDEALGLPERSMLHEMNTALRIHAFSNGRVGQTVRLLDEARAQARKNGRPKLTHDLLAQAVDLLRIGRKKSLANPFRVADPMPGGERPVNVRDAEEPGSSTREEAA